MNRFIKKTGVAAIAAFAMTGPAYAAVPETELVSGGTAYILNTLLFLIGGFLGGAS